MPSAPLVRRTLACLAAAALLFAALPARARAADYKAAKKKFQSAQKAYADRKYDRAVEDYKAAYEAGKDPAIYFNLAQAYEGLGDSGNAIKYYRNYIIESPKGADRPEAEKHLGALEEAHATEAATKATAASGAAEPQAAAAPATTPAAAPPANPAPAATPTATAAGDEAKTSAVAAGETGAAAPVADLTPPPPPAEAKAPESAALLADEKLSSMRKAGWGLVATTVALLTTGAILGLSAQERADDISRQRIFIGTDQQPAPFDAEREKTLSALESDGRIYNAVGVSLMAASGATAIVAAALFIADYRRGKKIAADKVSISPTFSPRHAGLSAALHF